MFFKLFLAFTLIPVIELSLLVRLGGVIGVFNTVLIVVLTGAAGAYLARMQGLEAMFRVRARLQQGQMPAEEMLDALIILVAGIVLLTPGLLTDLAGLLLLLPPTRLRFKRWLRQRLDRWLRDADLRVTRLH